MKVAVFSFYSCNIIRGIKDESNEYYNVWGENEKEVDFHEKIMKNDVCVFIKSETSLWKEMCNSYSVYIS